MDPYWCAENTPTFPSICAVMEAIKQADMECVIYLSYETSDFLKSTSNQTFPPKQTHMRAIY